MRFLFFKNPAKKNGILLLETEGACLCRPINWSMAAMLGNSAAVAVVVVVVVVRTRPRAIPLAMKTMRKFIHAFPFLSHMNMGLRFAARRAARAPLLIKVLCYKIPNCQFIMKRHS